MKYKQHFPTTSKDWTKNFENSEHNLNILNGIDNEQREKGELLWRYFRRNVGDGYAYYQVVKVTKKSAVVEVCTGICLDEWTDNMLREKCELPIKVVNDLIEQKDKINDFFNKTK